MVNKGARLDKQVAEHGVRFPVAQEVDDVRIDISAE